MPQTLVYKILQAHLVEGELKAGSPIGIHIDQTLTQDITGTMAMMEFEAMGAPRPATEVSVNYVDHNMMQLGFENADDHEFLRTFSARHGMYFSKPGNGICHQVHLERFSAPGKTLLGADSHTPTCGGAAMIAIGAGGLDVALAIAGQPFNLTCPRGRPRETQGPPPSVRLGQGRDPETPLHPLDQGQRRLGRRVRRRGRQEPLACPSGPPSPTWGRNSASRPASSRPTKSRGRSSRPRAARRPGSRWRPTAGPSTTARSRSTWRRSSRWSPARTRPTTSRPSARSAPSRSTRSASAVARTPASATC